MEKQKAEFPKYEELNEEERRRLRGIVDQGIMEAVAERPGILDGVGLGGMDAESLFDGMEPLPEVERRPHVLDTRQTGPGEFIHRIVFGRMQIAHRH